jgi:potassium efflux system protein
MPRQWCKQETLATPAMKMLVILAVAWATSATSVGVAQTTTATEEPSSSLPVQSVTSDQIEAELKQVEESVELEDATRAQLKDYLVQARDALTKTVSETKKSAEFNSWIESSAEDIQNARNGRDEPAEGFDFESAQSRELSELVTDAALLRQRLDEARKQLSDAQAEPQRRTARRTEISTALAAKRAELTDIESELKTLELEAGPPQSQRVQGFLLDARRQAVLATIDALENERNAYEAQGELPRLRIDLVAGLVTQLEDDARRLNALIATRRRGDAQAQKEEAEQAHASTPAALKPYAKKCVEWADLRLRWANDLQTAVTTRDTIAESLIYWRDDFQRSQKRVEDGASTTLGLMLNRKRTELPDALKYHREVAARVRDIREVQGKLFEMEDRKSELRNVDSKAATTIATLRRKKVQLPQDARTLLAGLYELESRVLESAYNDTERYFGLLVATNEDQEALADEVQQYMSFINEHVFWIRSTAPIQLTDFSYVIDSLGWLASSENWLEVVSAAAGRVKRQPTRLVIVALGVVMLLAFRQRIRKKVDGLGEVASARLCRQFAPTLQVLPLTLLLAAPIPLLLHGLGWAFGGMPDEFPLAVSTSLTTTAYALFSLTLVLQVCRPGGLAEAHLGWQPVPLSTARANLRLLVLAGIPLLFLNLVYAAQANLFYRASTGRLCHMALMLLTAFALYRIFRPGGGVLEGINAKGFWGWLIRHRRPVQLGLVLLPAGMALLSGFGYYYTARRLSTDIFWSIGFVFWLFVTEAILNRWVLIKRRQLRRQQLLDARERHASGEEEEKDDMAALAAEEEEVDLEEIDQQSRRLIYSLLLIVAILGLWSIWASLRPALAFVADYRLWSIAGPEGTAEWITVSSLVVAVLIAIFTFVAAKNIPGLVDIALLNRFTLESSLRYAVSTLCQYAIAIVGGLTVFHMIGIRWSNAQWLVAALSVGLGFGLQEVVANFICGILLLFERPIRVGDTVTLGDTTGVVVRIRSRATTVRNWDRQEVVVPNKELITGRIINWTLSDQWNRIVLTVGIAYGSDTRHACDVLMQILQEHPNVLEDPTPRVTFEQFGDSTLNFVIRAILGDMSDRIVTIHELHTHINERFAEEGIEIAFPQRDLHIRSVEQPADVSGISTENRKS